jgi:D-sedoheptulose 7-phosphate isomerase
MMAAADSERYMRNRIMEVCAESVLLKQTFFRDNADLIARAAETIAASFNDGNRLFVFGNGGSAADSQHIAAEFVNRYKMERPGLPGVALSTDTSILTSISNDYDFKYIFSRQLQALGQAGDVAWAISTSGTSPNIIEALKTARRLGLTTIALTGKGGDQAALFSDLTLMVDSTDAPRIQEVHIMVAHVICELVDFKLFQDV